MTDDLRDAVRRACEYVGYTAPEMVPGLDVSECFEHLTTLAGVVAPAGARFLLGERVRRGDAIATVRAAFVATSGIVKYVVEHSGGSLELVYGLSLERA